MKKIWILSLIFCCQIAFALPQIDPIPGGIARVELPVKDEQTPHVFFKNKRVIVLREDKKWLSLVGIPLSTKAEKEKITIRNLKKVVEFNVHKKQYRHAYIWLKNKRMVNPTINDQIRIQEESIKIHKILSNWTERDPFKTPFQIPIQGSIRGKFGTQMTFNKKLNTPHNGIDIRADLGTPIVPCNSGVVLATGDYFYSGKTVFVDHGKGVISIYAHLDKIAVKKGRHVSRASVLGTVGKTGRAQGPHLHWGMVMNQTYVNPMLFVHNT